MILQHLYMGVFKNMKNLLKSITFIFIFCILFLVTFKFFWLTKNPITYFYDEPKNTLDIVYVGASNVFNHFNSTLAFSEYGYATGLISFNSVPFVSIEYLLKEFEDYQDPQLYIIDISNLADDFSKLEEGPIRRVTDSIKSSKNRTELINKILSYTDTPKEDYKYYYYSFFTYHDLWKEPRTIKNEFVIGYGMDYNQKYRNLPYIGRWSENV